MKKIIPLLFFALAAFLPMSLAAETLEAADSLSSEATQQPKNNWRAKLRQSNFHLGLDIQTKYIWRGMEMMTEKAAPVLFPSFNYQWNGLFVYAMGGYAVNGRYAEVDLGISYTWKGLSIGFNDYYYPTVDTPADAYFKGGKNTGHWLEATLSYAPEKLPFWITASNFFYGADKILEYDEDDNVISAKQAYSSYLELGTYFDFLDCNRISLCVGAALNKSCYNGYSQKFSICNVEAKYCYTVIFKSGWTLPLSAAYIYNPVYDKSFVNFTVNLAL